LNEVFAVIRTYVLVKCTWKLGYEFKRFVERFKEIGQRSGSFWVCEVEDVVYL